MFQTPSVIIVCGPPGSGKSNFIRSFLYQKTKSGELNYGIVFARTSFNSGYDFIPKKYLHAKYDEIAVKRLLRLQVTTKNKGAAFLILDDCIGSMKFGTDFIAELITTYRHYNLTIIIATQYINRLPPTIRECAHYTIIFAATTLRAIKALFESYGQSFENYNVFKGLLERSTGNYFALLIRNSEHDKEHKFQKYKAPYIRGKFKLDY